PSILLSVIREVLEGAPASEDPAHLLAIPNREPASPAPESPKLAAESPASSPVRSAAQPEMPPLTQRKPDHGDVEYRAKARRYFLDHATTTCAGLRNNFQAFARAKATTEKEMQLQNLYRQVQFLAATSGLAECYPIARM